MAVVHSPLKGGEAMDVTAIVVFMITLIVLILTAKNNRPSSKK